MDTEGDGKLFRTWTLWYLIPDSYDNHIPGNDWTDYLHPLSTFDTIDAMWETLNSIGKAAQLPKGSRFYIFRKGVRPLWEDHANTGGALVSIEHTIANAKKQKISDRWTDLILSILGETFAKSDLVNGIEFTVRKGTYNICVWLSSCSAEEVSTVEKELNRIVNWKSPVKVTPIEPKK